MHGALMRRQQHRRLFAIKRQHKTTGERLHGRGEVDAAPTCSGKQALRQTALERGIRGRKLAVIPQGFEVAMLTLEPARARRPLDRKGPQYTGDSAMPRDRTTMLYILRTTTHALFDNMEDATAYWRQLKEDEPDGYVREPVRDPNEGLYVVLLSKEETVQASR